MTFEDGGCLGTSDGEPRSEARPGARAGKVPGNSKICLCRFHVGQGRTDICLAMSFYPHFKNQSCVMFNVSDPPDMLEGNLISKWPCKSNIRNISNIYLSAFKIKSGGKST